MDMTAFQQCGGLFIDGDTMRSKIRIAIAHENCSFLPSLRSALVSRLGIAPTDIYEIDFSNLLDLLQTKKINTRTDCLLVCVDSISEQVPAELPKIISGFNEFLAIVAGDFSTQQALDCIRAGALDCINVKQEVETDFANLSQFLTRLQTTSVKQQEGKLVAVMGCGGGSGASFVTTNIGRSLPRHTSVGLLDLNEAGGDLNSMLNVLSPHVMDSLLFQGDRVDEEMFEQSIQKIEDNIGLLSTDVLADTDMPPLSIDVLFKIGELARKRFPLSIADVKVGRTHADFASCCDQVVLVSRPTIPCVYRLNHLLEQLLNSGIRKDHIAVVLNHVSGVHELSLRAVEKMTGLEIFATLPSDPEHVNASVNTGLPLEKSALKLEIEKLTEKIFNLNGNTPASEKNVNGIANTALHFVDRLFNTTAK